MIDRGTLLWFARHEARLALRDLAGTLTGGGRRRRATAIVAVLGFAVFLHLLAYGLLNPALLAGGRHDKTNLVVVSGIGLLSWCLMLSQAIESVTRAFYARGDLDLILSSPAPARNLFAVRIAAVAGAASLLSVLLASPAVNVAAYVGGARWLAAYAVAFDMGIAAAAVAVALGVGLFRLLGPARTRTVAQVVAALIGSAFAIAIQGGAIMAYGDPSRLAFLTSEALVSRLPAETSLLWSPARAVLGDLPSLATLTLGALALLGIVIALFAPAFADAARASAGLPEPAPTVRPPARFRCRSPGTTLLLKEWRLLGRDPWLLSQSLMQILYLLPAALLLWRSIGEGASGLIVLVPVLVMAAGQLAGGLAWLAVSGEDAPELIATAPIPPGLVLRAKIGAVLGGIAIVFAPLVAVLAVAAPPVALAAATGITLAAVSATAIQLWFRSRSRRSQFRRRQTASRIATFAEAFSSILWASTAALAAADAWLVAFGTMLVTLLALAIARTLAPPARTLAG